MFTFFSWDSLSLYPDALPKRVYEDKKKKACTFRRITRKKVLDCVRGAVQTPVSSSSSDVVGGAGKPIEEIKLENEKDRKWTDQQQQPFEQQQRGVAGEKKLTRVSAGP